MYKTGTAFLPLHSGHCPAWLFPRMKSLGRAITEAIVEEHGAKEFVARMSNPFFFQSLGCVLGFDWHSSGLTTTVCGALKEGLKESDCCVFVLGGKGVVSRKTPQEISDASEKLNFSPQKTEELIYSSKMSAKVDSALVQDAYQLYHHCFILSDGGDWAVVQQGMNESNGYARRYHWLGEQVAEFVVEPHSAICCNVNGTVLNMTAVENGEARKASVDLVKEGAQKIAKYSEIYLPEGHWIDKRNYKSLENAFQFQPQNYKELASLKGIGAKTIRALALLSEIVYGAELLWKDPCRFSFAHGGKDGTPFPVERKVMDESTEFLRNAIEQANLGGFEKKSALKKLSTPGLFV